MGRGDTTQPPYCLWLSVLPGCRIQHSDIICVSATCDQHWCVLTRDLVTSPATCYLPWLGYTLGCTPSQPKHYSQVKPSGQQVTNKRNSEENSCPCKFSFINILVSKCCIRKLTESCKIIFVQLLRGLLIGIGSFHDPLHYTTITIVAIINVIH